MIVLSCPRCHADVPDPDLNQIIRFYGDIGGAECQDCGARITWQMTLTVEDADA